MKKFLAISMLAVVSTCIAFAGYNECTNNVKKVSIADALKMQDDAMVSIQGNIVKQLSNDKFQFKDSTGTMTVDIDHDKWAGIPSNTKDTLELIGEIDKDMNSTELDVDLVKKAQK